MIASIPSPAEGVWYLGPVPIRAYALAIMLGIVVAVWLGERRWIARGGRPGDVLDIAIWAVPFGIIGARVYHVLTDWDRYFGEGGDPVDSLRIWAGGLSIFGAIAGGVLGGYLAARRKGIPFPALADALAPGIVLAQAIGRWGNYFNQELFGRPTDVPWALEIDESHRPAGFEQFETFHPTFLYESLWAVAVAIILIFADRRFRMGHGRVFALYVALYAVGRIGIESLRIDTGGVVEGPAREILGMRINAWVSIALLVGAVLYIMISARLRPGREAIDLPPLEDAEAAAGSPKAEPDTDVAVDADADVDGTAKPKPTASTGREPASRAAEEPAVDTAAEEQAAESAKESVEERVAEPAVEPVEEPAADTSDEPVVDSVDEPAVDSADTPTAHAGDKVGSRAADAKKATEAGEQAVRRRRRD